MSDDIAQAPVLTWNGNEWVPTMEVSDDEDDIPDSEDLYAWYDLSQEDFSDLDSISTLTDQSGNGHDLTGPNGPTYIDDGIGGNPVARFDDADGDDYLDVSFDSVNQPVHHFLVARVIDTTGPRVWATDAAGDWHSFASNSDSNENWQLFAGDNTQTTHPMDEDPRLQIYQFDGEDSYHRKGDSSKESATDAGTNGLDGVTLGNRYDLEGQGNVEIAEYAVYPMDKEGIESDWIDYVSSKYGSHVV